MKRNSLDKAIIAWDFETTAVLSNQISQVSVSLIRFQVIHNSEIGRIKVVFMNNGFGKSGKSGTMKCAWIFLSSVYWWT